MFDFFKKFEGKTKIFISEKSDGNMKLMAEYWEKNRKKYFKKKYFKYKNLVSAKLEHGDNVEIIENDQKKFIDYCDGLLTDNSDIILSVTVADCFPVFLFDPNREVVGILHCGWRSVANGIVEKALEKMKKTFDCQLSQVTIGIGPGLQKCHFEIGKELKKEFSAYRNFFITKNDKLFLDLEGVITEKLISKGILKENIENSRKCTFCENKLWSYRKDGTDENGDIQAMIAGIKIIK